MSINDTFAFQNIGLPDDILRRKIYGDFPGAIRLIDLWLEREDIPYALRQSLILQREMMDRIGEEYPYSREEAVAVVREHIADFSFEEFEALVDTKKIDWIYVDGQMRIFGRFFQTLCKANPDFARRAGVKLPGVESASTGSFEDNRLNVSMRKMKQNGSMTNRIRIRATVRVKDAFFEPGMFIRAHLPIPCACKQQSDIRIERIEPPNGMISPENAAQRTVCWEERMTDNHEFLVEYSYLHTACYHDLHSVPGQPSQYREFTEEQAPHIVFTPYIRALVEELSKGITDPLEKARAFYDYITKNMKYTFMPSYFIMENIAETCARNLTGDCGVFALLFITMCRCAGIPACWQSGLAAEPDFCGGHDWVCFYVEPYGWVFADPSYGIAAVRAGNEERRQFYFGNLDPYRMVANSAFMAPFTVDKQHWRGDPYDNQVGEMETADRGLRYCEYERFKEVLSCDETE